MDLSNRFKEVRKSDGTHNLTDIDKLEEAVKEFIKKQLDNISSEQKISKGRDWQRSLLKLKAELETDAGKEFI